MKKKESNEDIKNEVDEANQEYKGIEENEDIIKTILNSSSDYGETKTFMMFLFIMIFLLFLKD